MKRITAQLEELLRAEHLIHKHFKKILKDAEGKDRVGLLTTLSHSTASSAYPKSLES
ncbi:MAG TPA: hypothetical protein VN929_01160 [Burkholderiales bacterium]|nr:hypothetical protein [Burkholderiales bacterium]